MANFQENLAACGGDLVQMSESYKTFGLQKNGAWAGGRLSIYLEP